MLAALLVLALPLSGWAQFTYTTNNGAITITGYTGFFSDGQVTIPSTINGYPVTAIGTNAFYLHVSVTDVTIPDTVTNIGDGAFLNCISLTNVTIPGSVTRIGDQAFAYCALTSIAVSTANPNYASAGGVLFNKTLTTPVSTNTLVNGTSAFVDPTWNNYPHRFYRL